MQLFVKTITGKTITIEVERTDTIKIIKEKIQDKIGAPTNHQTLLFAGKPLKNNISVKSVGLNKNGPIMLRVREPAAAANNGRGVAAAAANNTNRAANNTNRAANNRRVVTGAKRSVKNLAKQFAQQGGRKKKKTVAKKKTVTKKKVRKIHKGPRGGKYYISKGRKVYL